MMKEILTWHLLQIGRSVFDNINSVHQVANNTFMSMHVAMSYHVGSVVQFCMVATCLLDQWTCVCMCVAAETHLRDTVLMLQATAFSKVQHCLGTIV